MKRFGGFSAACLAAAMFVFAPLANAQVMQQVPSDALVVIKFAKLKATSDKIAAFAQKLGIAAFVPQLADPLGALKQKSKIQNGLDENGELAFVIPASAMDAKKETVLMLMPVSDYKAFIGNFADAQTAGDVTTAQMGPGPKSYIANWGTYAAIGTSSELVATKPTAGIVPAGVAAKELGEKDIVAYFNIKPSRDKMLAKIDAGREEFIKNIESGMNGGGMTGRPGAAAPAVPDAQSMKFKPVVHSLISRGFDVAEQMVRDADSATYGVSIGDDGLKITAMAEFNQGTPSAGRIATLKGTDQPMFAGIPANKYLFLMGAQSGDPTALQSMFTDFMAPIEPQFAALGDDGKALTDYVAGAKQYLGAIKTTATGMLVPSGALGQEAIFQGVGVHTGDAKAMLAAYKQMMGSQQAFMDMFTMPQMRGQMKMNYAPAAKTVDGVQFDQFTTQVGGAAGQPQSAQLAQMKQMMTWMYGPSGMNGLLGAVDDKTLVGTFDANDAAVSKTIASAKTGQDTVSVAPEYAAVAKQLPANRIAAAFIGLDQIVGTAANYAKMFGMPVNFQLPANLPPIGATVATEGSAIRADGYVPTQLLQSIIAAGIQSYMQMQGGQQPGGPGGL